MGKVLVKSEVFAKYSQILEGVGGCSILLRKSAVECFLVVPRHLKFLKNLPLTFTPKFGEPCLP